MAKNKRRTGKARPITSHQLFPAVLALWFGALFGLGSLAIRPSLIEQAVIASKIDLVIPAAAPPLGVTARILIALVLSALGAVIGTMIARRIARPKQEVRQRKRGAASLDAEPAAPRLNGSVIDAPMRQPILAHEELDSESLDTNEPQVALGGRRRALAIDHDEGDFVPYDTAPLPGGHLQILDVGGDEFGAAAAKSQAEPLDLGGFAEPQAAPATVATHAAAPAAATGSVELDWSQAKPILPGDGILDAVTPPRLFAGSDPVVPNRQMFQPQPVEPGDVADTSFGGTSLTAPVDSHDAVGFDPETSNGNTAPSYARPEPADPEDHRQIFGLPVVDGSVPRDAVKAAGYQVSVFDTPEPAPLFDRAPLSEVPVSPETPVSVAALAATAAPAPDPLPSPSGLAMDDLAARLAESMRRRRAAREAATMVVSAPVAQQNAADQPGEPDLAQSALAEAEVLAEAEALAEPEVQNQPAETTAPLPPPRFDPFANLPPIIVPEPVEQTQPVIPGVPLAMPAALRPLQFDDLGDDDPLDSLLPPRRMTIPAPESESETIARDQPEPIAPVVAPFAAPVAETSQPNAESAESEPDDAEAKEDNYGSLLELGRLSAASPFVRIEEPEAEGQAVEPVVIFPGQASRPAPIPAQFAPPAQFAAPAASAPAMTEPGEVASFRRFDAPAQAGQGQPVAAAPAPSPALDPVETERALRSALASLQRMSGAA